MSRKHRSSPDEEAVERYEFVLATGQPDQLFQVHAEAFAALTDEQRADLRTRLAESVDEADRPVDDRPDSLARVATDLEVTRAGSLERVLGPLLPAVAASVMVSPLAIARFPYGYASGSSVWQDDADDDSPLL
jgi:hypothetical protein